MNANLDQIDLLRERTGASYQDAKDALEKNNFDIVESIVYLEKQGKSQSSSCNQSTHKSAACSTIKEIIRKGNRTKFVIEDNESVTLNIPVTLAVVTSIIFPPVALIGIPAALLTNHKIKLKGEEGENSKVNSVLDKVSDTVTDAKVKFTEHIHKENETEV
jgi:virulence-associated protein VapD